MTWVDQLHGRFKYFVGRSQRAIDAVKDLFCRIELMSRFRQNSQPGFPDHRPVMRLGRLLRMGRLQAVEANRNSRVDENECTLSKSTPRLLLNGN